MKKTCVTVALLSLVLFAANSAFAQTGASQFSGRVQDPTKALIPGVTLTLTNTGTGVTATQLSNETGAYTFPGVSPGTYRLTAQFPGFKQSLVNDLEVGSNVQVRYDFTVEVGAVTTELQVSGLEIGRVLTEGATVGVVLPTDQLRALPMVSGNVLELLAVLPGYLESPFNPAFGAVGGLGLNTVNATIDGLSTNSPRNFAELFGKATLTTTIINPDLVSEIRLILAPVDAELGHGNSQVQIHTRSGTNTYRGSIVWNVQNSAFSANTWDNNNNIANGRWAPTPLPWTNRHQITASYGGPIVKNKTFFFALYDHQSVRNRDLVTSSVLTDTARQGIFRYWSGWNSGNALVNVPQPPFIQFNPTWPGVDFDGNPRRPDKNTDGSNYTGGLYCFSVFGNVKVDGSPFTQADCQGGTAVLRGSAWDTRRTTVDPTGYIRKVIDLMPRANFFASGGDGLNFASNRYVRGRKGSDSANAAVGVVNSLIDQGNRKQLNLKIDENITDRHRVSVGWQYQMEDSADNIAAWESGLSGTIKRRPQILTVNSTSTLSPSLLNEARFGMNRGMEQSAPAWNHPTNEKIREAATNLLPTGGTAPNGYVYRVRFEPVFSGYLGSIGGATDSWSVSPFWNFADTVSWSHGKHFFRFGGETRLTRTKWYTSGAWPTAFNGLVGTAPDYLTNPTVYSNELPGSGTLLNTRNNMAGLIYFLNGSISSVTHPYWIDGGSDIANGVWEDTSTQGNLYRSTYSTEWSFFLKDDFKLTRNFTLNVGLRYDYFGSPYLGNGFTSATKDGGAGVYGVGRPRNGDLLSNWLTPGNLYLSGYGSNLALNGLAPLTCSNTAAIQPNLPAYAKPNCDPALMSTLEFVGPKTSNPDKTLVPNEGAFGPAIGFAWHLPWFGEGMTSLRGGWQRTRGTAGAKAVFGFDGADATTGTLASHLNDANIVAITATRALNLTDLSILVPSAPARVTPGSPLILPIAGRTRNLVGYDPDFVNQYTNNFTLSVTRTLTRNLSLDTRYVGTFGRMLLGLINLNTLNVFHNKELFDALERTRAGQDDPLFDQLLQGLNLNSTGTGPTSGPALGYAAIGTTPATGLAAGRLQRGSAHLRRAQAANLANGNYVAVVNFLLGLTASTPGFQTAATLPAGVSQSQRVIRNGCDRMANGLTGGIAPSGGTVIPARCFPEDYFNANPQLISGSMFENYGRSNAHLFQSTLTLRPTQGMSFSGTFTWEKIMALPGTYTDPSNRELDYQTWQQDSPMGFRASGAFELPIGPNKLLMAGAHGWVARLLEKWQTSFIFNTYAGIFRPVSGNTMLYANGRPDVVGPWTNPKVNLHWDGNIGYAFGNPSPFVPFVDPQCGAVAATDSMGFNLRTSCTLSGLAAIVPAGTPGAFALADGSARFALPVLQQAKPGKQGTLGANTMSTFPVWLLSANASKSFRVSETVAAQLRIDATNVLNHPYPFDPSFSISGPNFGLVTTKGGTPRQFTAQLRLNF